MSRIGVRVLDPRAQEANRHELAARCSHGERVPAPRQATNQRGGASNGTLHTK